MITGTDGPLHYRLDTSTGGDGADVLVLGPSLGTDLGLFDPQVQAFAGEYRVVRFDLPGHGRSPTPRGPYTVAVITTDLLTVLDRLRVGRFHYAGISLGGAIGQQLAVDHADRLLSLTAVATAARFAAPSSWPTRAATVREKGTEAMVGSRPGTWFTHAFPRSHPDRAERLLSMLRDTRDEGYAGCCEAIAEFDLSARLHTVATPTLAIAGADDPATPPPMLQVIADTIPGGRCVTIEHAAHLPNIEQAEQFNEVLAGHLAQVNERRRRIG